MVAAIYGWPYARRESGLGSLFQGVNKWHVTSSLIVALLTTTIFACWAHPDMISSSTYPPIWIIVLSFAIGTFLAGWILATYMSRKLGGLTGDTYGALNELLEVLLLLGVTVLFASHG